MLEQFVDLAGKKVHVEKRPLTGPQTEAFAAAVRQEDVHLLAVPVSGLTALHHAQKLLHASMWCTPFRFLDFKTTTILVLPSLAECSDPFRGAFGQHTALSITADQQKCL